jgi:Tfp pilus assembly protein PilX
VSAFWRRRRLRRVLDDGVALLTVVGSMAIITLFLLTALMVVLNNAPKSRESQDSQTAMAAAQAGMEDYIARLNANGRSRR